MSPHGNVAKRVVEAQDCCVKGLSRQGIDDVEIAKNYNKKKNNNANKDDTASYFVERINFAIKMCKLLLGSRRIGLSFLLYERTLYMAGIN